MQNLEGMLAKFRLHKVAFTADIEKAFLQIKLNKEDRDATRFLWLREVNKSANSPDNIYLTDSVAYYSEQHPHRSCWTQQYNTT